MPLLAVGCMAFAAEPLFDEVPQIAVTPLGKQIVDGKRDADEDRFSAGMYGFCMLQMKQFPAEARFNVSTDGKHLFLSAQCETGPDGILQRSRKGRGGERAFLDDSFEFVIIPNPEAAAPSIYHLILNNRGSYMAAGKSGAGNIAWDPKFTCTGNVRGNLWTFELTLPLSQFGISEWKDGQSIGLRFCRNWRRLKKEFGGDWGRQTSWEQKYAQFFSSDFLPKLTLRREAPVVRFLSLRKGKEPDIRISLFNPGKTPLALRLFYRHQPINSQSVTREDSLTLAPGEKRELSLPTAQITEGETISTGFKVTSLDGEKIYYHRAFTWQLEQPDVFASADGDSRKIAFHYAYYPESDSLYAVADLSAMKELSKLKKITLELRDKSGGLLASATMPPLRKKTARMLWKLPPLKEITMKSNLSGEYTLTVTAHGIPDAVIVRKFERKVFAWEGNTFGKSDRLIAPFTPIRVKGDTVSAILRDHVMNGLGLWKQVNADGEKLFRDNGIAIEAVINGRKFTADGTIRFTKQTPTQVICSSQWHAGALNATAVSDWDYDGMMKYTLELQPLKEKIDSLKLIVPLDPANAYLFHACTDGLRFNYGGATPQAWNSTQAPRSSIQSSYVNYIWLGTEGRGFSVFGENDRGWSMDGKIPAQELIRRNGTVYLVCNLIARQEKIKTPRRIVLGFQATPVKPMPENWRLRGFNTGEKIRKYLDFSLHFLGSSYCQGGLSHSNDLFPRDFDYSLWKAFAETRRSGEIPSDFIRNWNRGYRDKSLHETYAREIAYGFGVMKNAPKNSIMFYTNARGMRLDIPDARTFLDNWFREEFQTTREKEPEYGDFLSYSVDPGASYRDFALYHYNRMLTMGVTDKLYWDDIFLAANWDRSGAGDAYEMEDGRLQPSVGLWNIRALIRRAAIHMDELGKKPYNMIHMTNTAIAPISAFAQQHLDWEDHMGVNPFQMRYTREYIRTVSIGRQFGNRPFAIGLVDGKSDPVKKQVCLRSRSGVMYTHEINNMPPALYEFGYGKPHVRVWNYWEKEYPAAFNGETSSILVTKKGAAALIVCNYDRKEDFMVKLDLAKIGISREIRAEDNETKEPLSVNGNTISFKMKKFDYIYIDIKEK